MLDSNEMSLLIDDRPGQSFTIDRRAFTDESIFEAEMKSVFEGTWNFIGLETQLPEAHSFFTTHIGRQPVIVSRDANGEIGCFLNSCRHRGMLVCLFKQGNRKLHVCRYHNWSYDSGGRNRNVTFANEGAYGSEFAQLDHDLVRVRLDSYRGMMFASLNPNVPDLASHLGDAKVFLDLLIDQSPVAQLELIPGGASYAFEGNWKLQFENGLDVHHFQAVHPSYADIMAGRVERGLTGNPVVDDDGLTAQGVFGFKHGHAVYWQAHARHPWGRPINYNEGYLDSVRERVGKARAKWMMRSRNLTIFPNLQIVDVQTAQLRTWRPLSAGRTEMKAHCLGMVGEPPEARAFRMRAYEHFFDATGLASSDDNMMYELSQAGYAAEAGRTQGYQRGIGLGPESAESYARELGISPAESVAGPPGTDAEVGMQAGYREWQRLLSAGAAR